MAHIMDNIKYHFSESEVKCITMQLLSALAYLHGKWIIHRDIKLSNLLYNRYGGLKLADFGLARTYSFPPRSMTNKVVSLWYRAPELLFQSRYYNPGIDIWSVGCVLGELLTNRPLLPGKTDIEQLSLIFELFGAPTDQIWPDIYSYPLLLDNPTFLVPFQRAHVFNRINTRILDIGEHGYNFINSLMMYDPRRRITAKDALRHPYFDTTPYPKETYLMPTFPSHHEHMPRASNNNSHSDHQHLFKRRKEW